MVSEFFFQKKASKIILFIYLFILFFAKCISGQVKFQHDLNLPSLFIHLNFGEKGGKNGGILMSEGAIQFF